MPDPVPFKGPHRPIAMASIPQPELPLDGVARNYSDLVALLKQHRRVCEISQMELDDRAGFQDGYTGKLEIPHKADGRVAKWDTLRDWMEALGVGIKLVPLSKPKKGWKRERIAG